MCFHIGKRSVHDYKEFGANIWTNSKQAVSQVMHPAPRNHPSATCSLTANCETKPLHEAQSPVRGEAFVYGAAVENQPDGCHVSCSCSIKGFRADGADCRSGEVRREWDVLCECVVSAVGGGGGTLHQYVHMGRVFREANTSR